MRGFWIVAYLLAATMAFAGAPAPLLVVYQSREGLSTVEIATVFAALPVGVVVALVLAGHLSDRFGRVRSLVPAVALNVLAGLILLTATEFAWLLVARFLSGLGVGMLTPAATAHLTELSGSGRRAEVVSTAANIGGIGAGMLVAGVLADLAPAPLHTPYLVLLFAMAAGLLVLPLAPETVPVARGPWRYRPQRLAVPASARPVYAGALLAGFVAFAMFGVFSGLSGSFLSAELGIASHAVAGLVAFAAFAASATVQVFTSTWSSGTQQATGVAFLAAGLALLVAGLGAGVFPLFLAGGMVTGAGTGALLKASISAVVVVATGGTRAEALAGLFLASYVGMSLPIVLLGALMQVAAPFVAVLAFGSVMLVLIVLATAMVRAGGLPARNG